MLNNRQACEEKVYNFITPLPVALQTLPLLFCKSSSKDQLPLHRHPSNVLSNLMPVTPGDPWARRYLVPFPTYPIERF